ncbi:MAG: hypothetical protein U0802_08270 [Candidatus Binatia bacterium]
MWRYDLDPWRFFGWAMYCTPKLPAEVTLFAVEHGARVPVEASSLSDAARRDRCAARAAGLWGTLSASPERAGAALRAARPEAEAVEVVVSKWYLDPATATIATREEIHRFAR